MNLNDFDKELRICSVSGGKDSTALYLLMVETYGQDFLPIFADTGNEHPVTVNYVRNLHVMAGGPQVVIVKADFKDRLRDKRKRTISDARTVLQLSDKYGSMASALYRDILRKARTLIPSGNPFLDMMVWKGRALSSAAQFCTEWVKLLPISIYLQENYPMRKWIMFTGIRAGESERRSRMHPFSYNSYFYCDQVLPLLYETEEFVYKYLEEKGVPPNPLYLVGMPRVGCYPCIHSNKTQLRVLEDWVWDKLEEWEQILGRSWFPSGILPGKPTGYIPSIKEVREWCKTLRGGIKYDLFAEVDKKDVPSCMGTWGICE